VIEFKSYDVSLRGDCLRLFDSNIPKFFHETEAKEYGHYLDEFVSDNYWCIFDQSLLMGAGGIWIHPDGITRLVWGIINSDLSKPASKKICIGRAYILTKWNFG